MHLVQWMRLFLAVPMFQSYWIFAIMSKPSVKMAEKLPTDLQETFIRKAQQINAERMSKANMIKARNRLSGVIMAAVVGSICKC